jgi:hypothetical protein
MLEQILIAKVFNLGSGPGQAFGGICPNAKEKPDISFFAALSWSHRRE